LTYTIYIAIEARIGQYWFSVSDRYRHFSYRIISYRKLTNIDPRPKFRTSLVATPGCRSLLKTLVGLATSGGDLHQGLLRLELLDQADDSGSDEDEQQRGYHDRHGLRRKDHKVFNYGSAGRAPRSGG